MAVSDLYDTFFIDNENEFTFIGSPDSETAQRLKDFFANALNILKKKNNQKYIIRNDVRFDNLFVEKQE